MIFDILENAGRYSALHPGFAKAFEFLNRSDLEELAVGRYDIDGDKLFAMVAKDPGRHKQEAQLETHAKYIDIQMVLAGIDEMGWRPKSSCRKPAGDYDLADDIQFFIDQPEAWLSTTPGRFVIFFPEDAHLPLISPEVIHKVVVKVGVRQD